MWLRPLLAISVLVLCPTLGFAQEQAKRVYFNTLGGPHGLRQYRSDHWGVVRIDAANPTDEDVEPLATFGFARDPDLQFARSIWIPAGAKRLTWSPVRLPQLPDGTDRLKYFSALIDRQSGSEVVLRSTSQQVQNDMYLRVNEERMLTGVITGEKVDYDAVDYAYETIIALRTKNGFTRRLAMISDKHLPAIPEALDCLDQLVLYNDRFADDIAGMAAIRSWLHDGGRLWVMLDRVEFDGLEQLLGDTFSCELVDRVELDQVEIKPVTPRSSSDYPPRADFEEPLNFARVFVSDMNVVHTVNGWPAAFWRDVGRGRVIFTAVEGRAWIHRRTGIGNATQWDDEKMTNFIPNPQLDELPIMEPRARTTFDPKQFEPYLSEQIGYRIASRTPVAAILMSMCVGLTVVGVWLAKKNRLDRLGWIAPLAAFAATAPLLALGLQSKTAPPTLAQAQLIEVGDISDRITVSGLMGIYNRDKSEAPLGAENGGMFEPDLSGIKGQSPRMVWSDANAWQWENLELPPGVRWAPFHRSATLDEQLEAVGGFTANGFEGDISGPVGAASDCVLAIPGQPRMTARVEGSSFAAASADVLAPGQYIMGALLSDEQQRRQAVYQRLLDSAGENRVPTRPTLLFWTDPLEMQFKLPSDLKKVGSALAALPLKLRRSPAGSKMLIPAPFLRYRSVPGPGSSGASSLYNARNGEWVQSKSFSNIWLRFQIPREVLPMSVESGVLKIKITAPDRTLTIQGAAGDTPNTLMTQNDPIGEIKLDVTDAAQLQLDEEGGLLLGFQVSDVADPKKLEDDIHWKIDQVQLEVAGRAEE